MEEMYIIKYLQCPVFFCFFRMSGNAGPLRYAVELKGWREMSSGQIIRALYGLRASFDLLFPQVPGSPWKVCKCRVSMPHACVCLRQRAIIEREDRDECDCLRVFFDCWGRTSTAESEGPAWNPLPSPPFC